MSSTPEKKHSQCVSVAFSTPGDNYVLLKWFITLATKQIPLFPQILA